MALLKICKCGKTIPYNVKRCEECQAKYEQKNKRKYTEKDKARWREYQKQRDDKEEQAFYMSKTWKLTRDMIVNKFYHIDVYLFIKYGIIEYGNIVHHIVELKEDFSKRLSEDNLILLSQRSHLLIHEEYNNGDKVALQEELKQMVKDFEKKYKNNKRE